MEKGAGRSTRRVLPWHGYGLEYLQGTAEEMEVVMCDWPELIRVVVMFDWPPAFLLKRSFPLS
jgi:hypothetical protein